MTSPICKVDGCGRSSLSSDHGRKGFCSAHYERFRRHGDPLGGRVSKGEPEAFIQQVVLSCDGEECLIWPYSTKGNGYGQINVGGRRVVASRYICEAAHGSPPSPDHQAAHACGNGHLGCVNPKHLSWKTSSENHADKLIHGTHSRGERSPLSKLSEEQVLEIMRLKGVKSQTKLAAEFGVATNTIAHIHNGRTWSWLRETYNWAAPVVCFLAFTPLAWRLL